MNRTVQISAWGLAGILLTGALTGAAVAVAGNGIATPARPFSLTSNRVEQPVQASEPHEGPSHDQGKGSSGEGAEPGGSNGGDSTSGSNSGPGSESSGPGSGDSGGSDEGSGDSGGGSDEGSGDSGGDHDGDDGDDDD